MKLALIQTNPQSDFDSNLKKSLDYIHKSAQMGADLVMLPETFLFMGHENERRLTWQKNSDEICDTLSAVASNLQIYLIAGSFDETHSGFSTDTALSGSLQFQVSQERVYNTCYAFTPNGNIISKYRKLHLFNLCDEHQQPIYCESDVYKVGTPPTSYEITCGDDIWTALNIICYDLRFPEIVRSLNQPCDVIFVPAAFTWQTGRDHWEILLRARAIENQCFVVACNQTGSSHEGKKQCYGNSMIVDPWGNILARLGEEEDILMCEISKSDIHKSRTKLPAIHDRKIFIQTT